MEDIASLIEHVATVDAPLESELDTYSRPLQCRVGDPTYNQLVNRIKELMLDRIPRERLHFQAYLEEALSEGNLTGIQDFRKTLANIELSIGLDYSDGVRAQGANAIVNPRPLISLNGLPCVVGDSHKLAYDSILSFTQDVSPVTLLRFDAHNDCYSGGEEATNANYVMKLLERHPRKFSEIITLNANYFVPVEADLKPAKVDPRFTRKHTLEMFHSVPILSGILKDFVGRIKGNVIIDIDMDGLEMYKSYPGFGPGGNFKRYSNQWGVHYYNQQDILMHPFEAALSLRSMVDEKPLAVLVHTERTYRNRYFHHRVEYDFLRALAVDDLNTLNE